MILTASDVESLSRSLSRWEWGEYISELFVIIACAGEFVADLEARWLTEERKKHLQKRSTILLVAALSASLACLIRTNELSGNVIGSLGQKAEEADQKAKKAISDSSTAATKAETAQESAGEAQDESRKAQDAGSNALTLARGARQEADSFERDIVSAKKLATDAESHLADALKQAAAATAELNLLKSPRSLTNVVAFVSAVKDFKGAEYTFSGVSPDEESVNLLKEIDIALQLAGWKRLKPPTAGAIILNVNVYGEKADFGVPPRIGTGVLVSVDSSESADSLKLRPQEEWPLLVKTAVALKNALSLSVSPAQGGIGKDVIVESGTSTTVRIIVGKKP
jgi:hypothetical protein